MPPEKQTHIPIPSDGFVSYISHMGDDLTVVNAARVSFSNKHTEFVTDEMQLARTGKDEHFSPFCHPQITLHMRMPIFVARQFMKSTVGVAFNEVSRRYVDDTPAVFKPLADAWRLRAANIKQGSSSDTVTQSELFPFQGKPIDENVGLTLDLYEELIEKNVAPELARVILPLSTYTEFWVTMSLAAAFRIYRLRTHSHAQKEIQDYANAMGELITPLFPYSWKHMVAFEENKQKALKLVDKAAKLNISVDELISKLNLS